MPGTRSLALAHRRIFLLLVTLLSLTFSPEVAMAQDSTTPPDPNQKLKDELERAKLEKDLATAQKDREVAEKDRLIAERDALLAQIPATTTKGMTGDVTLKDGAGYFAEVLAYQALAAAAQTITTDDQLEKAIKGKVVVLSDQHELAANDVLWQQIDNKLGDFEARFTSALKPDGPFKDGTGQARILEGGFALAAVPALLGAAADIAAFFRVNREFSGRQVTLSGRALIAELAAGLQGKCEKVIVPGLRLDSAHTLIGRLNEVQKQRRQAAELRQALETKINPKAELVKELGERQAELRAELVKLEKKDPPPTEEIKALKAEIQKLADERRKEQVKVDQFARVTRYLDPLIAEFNTLETVLTSRPSGQTLSPLEAVATVDAIRFHSGASVLYAGIVSQGAEIEVTKSAWWSGRVSYIGGTVVTYLLVEDGGAVKASGMVPARRAASFKGADGAQQLGDSP